MKTTKKMKNTFRPASIAAAAGLLGVNLFYVLACSKIQASKSLSSSDLPQISARQDQPFNYTLAGSGSGAFTISALPGWVSFNASTGTLSGTPTVFANAFDFTAYSSAAPQSPLAFHVNIVGNPLKEYQWHLGNTGQTAFAFSAGIAGNDIHLSNTISSGITGSGVKIAISDSGVVINHEGLTNNVLSGLSRNYLLDYPSTHWVGDPTPDLNTPDDAHGTGVAGLAVETGWNGLGGRGVAPDASFAGFLFIPAQDALTTAGLYDAALLEQFSGSFDIYNYSWGDSQCELVEYGTALSDALQAGVTSQRAGKGAIYVRASGNSYYGNLGNCYGSASGTGYYGSAQSTELDTMPYTVEVGASNANGVRSSYSSPGANVWISAPGGEFGFEIPVSGASAAVSGMPALISTDYPGCALGLKSFSYYNSNFDRGLYLNSSCNYTSTMNGTSGATPIASGAIALLLQANTNLSWRDVKHILATTADQIDAGVNPSTHPTASLNLAGHAYEQGWVTNAAGYHFMNYYGFGRVNVDNAVALAKTYTSGLGTYTSTGWNSYDSGTVSAAIPAHSTTGLTQSFSVTQTLTTEEVQVKVSVSNCVSATGIELVSPSGTRSHLANINSNLMDSSINDHTYLSNAFYGEPSNGTWTLNLINASTTCAANLTHWALNVYGH